MKRKRTIEDIGQQIAILLILLILLTVIVFIRVLDHAKTIGQLETINPVETSELFEEHTESGLVIRPLQSPELEEEPAATPTLLPTQQPTEQMQNVIVLEDHGALEILVPEGMETDGF